MTWIIERLVILYDITRLDWIGQIKHVATAAVEYSIPKSTPLSSFETSSSHAIPCLDPNTDIFPRNKSLLMLNAVGEDWYHACMHKSGVWFRSVNRVQFGFH